MDIAPGIKSKSKDDEKTDLAHILELQGEIVRKQLDEEQALVLRKKTALNDVVIRLNKMLPVTITDEMRELGIDQEVWRLTQRAELVAPFMRAFQDDEDDDD